MSERVDVFSNGEEYRAWLSANCVRCKKYDPEQQPICDIDNELLNALLDDGCVSREIADRMDYQEGPPFRLGWPCPEREAK